MEPSAASSLSNFRWIRPQAFIWIPLFAALALYGLGSQQSPLTMAALIGMGLVQTLEPSLEYFATPRGAVVLFVLKLTLCYLLIDRTGRIASSYYWLLLLPVMSAATSFGLLGTAIATLIACGTYLSFLALLEPNQYIPPEEIPELTMRIIGLAVVGYLTHQLAESKRAEANRYQGVAQELAKANENLQKAEAAANRSERLAALGQLSAGLAHELRNPLGTMKTSAEMLLRSVEGENEVAKEMAEFISSEVDRTDSLITRFLDFARPLAVRLEEADLGQVIDRAVLEVERHRPPYDVAIYKNYSPDIRPFRFDPELLQRVFYNLILNAVQASPARGSVTVKTRALNRTVEVAIIDRGSGIDSGHLENIFNPFFTTKSTGVGLGLAIVSKIVDEHGGKIAVESTPGSGSVFRVYLPALSE